MDMTGGCLCGAVRFSYDGDIGPAGYCHCEDCRRCTGSAFNISVKCRLSAFHPRGAMGGYTKVGSSGFELRRYFCLNCGSPIYTSSHREPDLVYVKAGIFDDPGLIKPALEAWTCSEVAWAAIPLELARYERSRSEADMQT
jgi:hypothetical protein